MEITEVRIKLMEEPGERLKAFCSITFDDAFVVRDLKIIEGSNGPFVAMPSRKLTAHCGNCRAKNHLRAAFCNQCGARLKEIQTLRDEEGRAKLYADIAHPINSACREMIQQRVIQAFTEERQRAQQPGYVSTYDEYDQEERTMEARPQPAPQTTPAQTTQIQQAEKPRGPHKMPAQQPENADQPKGGNGNFGAGILE
ncbi:MAG: SpoVG family protein [Thermoguttaceae bacterium]